MFVHVSSRSISTLHSQGGGPCFLSKVIERDVELQLQSQMTLIYWHPKRGPEDMLHISPSLLQQTTKATLSALRLQLPQPRQFSRLYPSPPWHMNSRVSVSQRHLLLLDRHIFFGAAEGFDGSRLPGSESNLMGTSKISKNNHPASPVVGMPWLGCRRSGVRWHTVLGRIVRTHK